MKMIKTLALLSMALLMAGCVALAESPQPAPHEHHWTTISRRNPTCTSQGKSVKQCTGCGAVKTSHRSALGHNWADVSTIQEATCQEDGQKRQKCSRCGTTRTVTIQSSDQYHVFGDWTVSTPATDHSQGTRWAKCAVCGTRTEEQFDPEGTLRRNDKGDAVKELQSLLACRGYYPKRKNYGGSFDSATEKAVKKLQEERGLNVDGVAWPQTIALLGHQYGAWEVESVKSETSIGKKHRTCALCNYTENVEERPSPMYQKGDKDGRNGLENEIHQLQTALNDAGYNCGYPDGDYGGKTMNAIKNLQRDHGMTEDGVAWPGVLKLLGWKITPEGPALALTVRQVTPARGDQLTFEWELANIGSEACDYWCIRCVDRSSRNAIMTVGTCPVGPENKRTQKGRFSLTSDMRNIEFYAEGTGAGNEKYSSEAVTCSIAR